MAKNETAPAHAPEPKTEPDASEPKAVLEPKPESPPKRPPYIVADGKSLTCNRGVLGPGDEIKPRDLNDNEAAGRKQLDELAAKGYVVKSG